MIPFAIDTETALIEYTKKAPELVCVSTAMPKVWDHENPVYKSGEPCELDTGLYLHDEVEDLLKGWITDKTKILVGAYMAYDMGVIMQKFPKLTPYIWDAYWDDRVQDVLIRQKLYRIAYGDYWILQKQKKKGHFSLKGVTKALLDIDLDKGEDTWRMRYMELHGTPIARWPRAAKEYAIGDAEVTVIDWLEQEVRFGQLLDDSCRQARAGWWIHLMTAWGICTDQQAVERLAREVQRDYDEVERYLKQEGLVKTSGKKKIKVSRDTKAAAERMIAVMGEQEKEVQYTPSGNVKLTKDLCKESEDDGLIGYADLTHLKTLLSKELTSLQKPEVHSYFEVLLETGRTSSSAPNLQNPARKGGIRECYIPRPGCVLIDSDYDIIELRTFAQVCLWTVGHSKLAEALNAGYDPHLSLGAQVLGISYEEAVARKRDKDVKDARQNAKPGNFGFPGGMGATKFRIYAKTSYGVEMTEEEAVQLRDAWFDAWPEAREYFNWVTDRTQNEWYFDVNRGEDSCRVQQFVANRWRGGCSYTEGCNTRFQGLASDIAKNAGFLIARECYDASLNSPLFGARIVCFIHDQFLVECFEEIAHEAAQRVRILMVQAAEPFIPDVPASCTPALSSCWSKGAEAVYDTNKRLMVWDPAYEKLEKAAQGDKDTPPDPLAAEVIAETKARHVAWYAGETGFAGTPPRFAAVAHEVGWEPPKKVG